MQEWTPRDRFLAALNHQKPDRVPIHDSPWDTAITRWHREGLPEDQTPEQYFNFELRGYGADLSFQVPQETLEETEEYTIVRNENGAIVKNWKDKTSVPMFLEFPFTDRKGWEEFKPRLEWNDSRIKMADYTQHQTDRDNDLFVTYGAPMGYDRTQGWCGSETLLMAMVEDPAWVCDMVDSGITQLIQGYEAMTAAGFKFDAAFVFDDMGYRNSSLFSPRAYREILFPAHKRLCDFMHGQRLKVILHSCGCVKELIPQLIEAGFDCLQPLEVKAGMDLIELKKLYGKKLAFMGGIDVRAMADPDPAVIEEEIRSKFDVAMSDGGYIYHSDHSVPDNVSFERYKQVIDLVLKYGKYE